MFHVEPLSRLETGAPHRTSGRGSVPRGTPEATRSDDATAPVSEPGRIERTSVAVATARVQLLADGQRNAGEHTVDPQDVCGHRASVSASAPRDAHAHRDLSTSPLQARRHFPVSARGVAIGWRRGDFRAARPLEQDLGVCLNRLTQRQLLFRGPCNAGHAGAAKRRGKMSGGENPGGRG